VIGIGILAKYTMILWIPSAALFLSTSSIHRKLLFRRGFWIMTGCAAVCCAPILIWNIKHDWVSFRHVTGQAGMSRARGLLWLGPLNYVGTQFALFLGFWFVAWAGAMISYRPWKEQDTGIRYLWWLSAPMFGVFLLFSLKTAEEPNWPITAYLSGLVLMVAWIAGQLQAPTAWYRRLGMACCGVACTLGLAATVLMHHTEWVQGLLLRMSGPPTETRPFPLRRFDPTCRLRGWRFFAQEVDRLSDRLRHEGIEPLLAASTWNLPGELAFYCRDNPTVYSFGLALGDRHSQYDLWQPNPVSNSQAFRGRTFIYIGDVPAGLREAFDSIGPSQAIVYRECGQPIAAWRVTVCSVFRGFSGEIQVRERAPF
jgi:hypothetical protein